MCKMYTKIVIGLVIGLWLFYWLQGTINREPFVSNLYRPYIRTMNQKYESFMDNYGPNTVVNKLKKWNIY